jgi:hypothetical protein
MKRSITGILRDSVYVGALSSAASAVTAAACGQIENGNAVAPVNAISHIAWGDKAFDQSTLSPRFTLTGLALNDSAHFGWAVLFELLFGDAAEKGNVPVALLGGATVSGIAYLTDYHLVPPRLMPGFEKHLSGRSLLIIYVVLALTLAIGGLTKKRWRS